MIRKHTLRLAFAVACALAAGVAARPASLRAAGPETKTSRLADLMTKGKLDADIGRHQDAIEAFEAVSRDAAAPAALRWEALVRLGIVRRQAGDPEGSVKAYQQVAVDHGTDPEAMRFLTLAVAGVVPGAERWQAIWKDVRLAVERGAKGEPKAAIVWPGSAPRARGTFSGEPITLELKDARIEDVLRNFSILTKLNIVLDPAEQGTVTMRMVRVPWDEALERILESQGLAYSLTGSMMKVARP